MYRRRRDKIRNNNNRNHGHTQSSAIITVPTSPRHTYVYKLCSLHLTSFSRPILLISFYCKPLHRSQANTNKANKHKCPSDASHPSVRGKSMPAEPLSGCARFLFFLSSFPSSNYAACLTRVDLDLAPHFPCRWHSAMHGALRDFQHTHTTHNN